MRGRDEMKAAPDEDRQRDDRRDGERAPLAAGEQRAGEVEHVDEDGRRGDEREEQRDEDARLQGLAVRGFGLRGDVGGRRRASPRARWSLRCRPRSRPVWWLVLPRRPFPHNPIWESSRSISRRTCGWLCRSSSAAQRKKITAINAQSRSPAPSFMISPAICWSSSGLAPEQLRQVDVRLVQRVRAEGQERRRDRRYDGPREQEDGPGERWQPRQLGHRAQHRQPDDQRADEQRRVEREVQRRRREALVHDRGPVREHEHHVVDDQRGQEPRQPAHRPEDAAGRPQDVPEQPGRRAEEQQRGGQHREHQVLHHVHAVHLLLGDVVDRPVGREPDRDDPEEEADDLEPRDRGPARRRRSAARAVRSRRRTRRSARRRGARRPGGRSRRGSRWRRSWRRGLQFPKP